MTELEKLIPLWASLCERSATKKKSRDVVWSPYITYECQGETRTELTLEVRMKIEKQWPEMWEEYLRWIRLLYSEWHNQASQAQNFYDWLLSTKDDPNGWAWIDCPSCAGTRTKHNYPYLRCPACLNEKFESIGRIRNPQFAEALAVMEGA